MRILFIDIDGPIVSYCSRNWLPGRSDGYYWEPADPIAVHAVRKIVEKTGCKIVFNTSHNPKGEYFICKYFNDAGYDIEEDLYEFTTTEYNITVMSRVHAIKLFLNTHKEITKWCAVDDDPLDGIDIDKKVIINGCQGIGYPEYTKICDILK